MESTRLKTAEAGQAGRLVEQNRADSANLYQSMLDLEFDRVLRYRVVVVLPPPESEPETRGRGRVPAAEPQVVVTYVDKVSAGAASSLLRDWREERRRLNARVDRGLAERQSRMAEIAELEAWDWLTRWRFARFRAMGDRYVPEPHLVGSRGVTLYSNARAVRHIAPDVFLLAEPHERRQGWLSIPGPEGELLGSASALTAFGDLLLQYRRDRALLRQRIDDGEQRIEHLRWRESLLTSRRLELERLSRLNGIPVVAGAVGRRGRGALYPAAAVPTGAVEEVDPGRARAQIRDWDEAARKLASERNAAGADVRALHAQLAGLERTFAVLQEGIAAGGAPDGAWALPR